MNTLKFYPRSLRKAVMRNVRSAGIEKDPNSYSNFILFLMVVLTSIASVVFYFLDVAFYYSIITFVFLGLFFYFKLSLKASARIKKMEIVFPDFISLMASNLRAGITVNNAFLLSARSEFAPLDKYILKTGKEVATGKEVVGALKNMSERIGSEKIGKVILLIISGLKAGGNISDLLEETSRNMKQNEVVEKKAASTIMMYVIFIFFAVAVGAPVLFALSSVLIEIVITLATRLPDTGGVSGLPFTFSKIPITVEFINYFSIVFIIVTDFISSLVIGLVNKGKGKAGLKYFIPLVVISILLFIVIKFVLSGILIDMITSF